MKDEYGMTIPEKKGGIEEAGYELCRTLYEGILFTNKLRKEIDMRMRYECLIVIHQYLDENPMWTDDDSSSASRWIPRESPSKIAGRK